MPRIIIQHSDEFPDYFAAWNSDELPTYRERGRIIWSQWPFENESTGCLACAWAHWYGVSYFDPCRRSDMDMLMTQNERMLTTNPQCGYAVVYRRWVRGGMPFVGDRAWLTHDRDAQRVQVDNLDMPQEYDDGEGCLACTTWAYEGGDWDPCSWTNRSEPNEDCAWYEWYCEWSGERESRAERRRRLQQRAAQRRGDYPQEWRSRRGRGECTMRRSAGDCPPDCPCRRSRREPRPTPRRRQPLRPTYGLVIPDLLLEPIAEPPTLTVRDFSTAFETLAARMEPSTNTTQGDGFTINWDEVIAEENERRHSD